MPASSWYHAQGAVPRRAPLAGGVEAETCIVGGGLAGLSLLLSLAERGRSAVLIEAHRLGTGASGLNGGMVLPGWGLSLPGIERRAGAADAALLYALSLEGMRLVRARIERHAIACDLMDGAIEAVWVGDPAAFAAWAVASNERFGTRLALWDRARTQDAYQSPRYKAALIDPDAFHLDPLAYLRGLADAAEAKGGRIHEATPALAVERQGGGFRVVVPGGAVQAGRVVLATGADGRGFCRPLDRAILPLLTGIVVTEPLGDSLRDAVQAGHAVIDDRFVTGYYRPLPEGRLLWGGGLATRADPDALRRRLLLDLAQVYPQLGRPAATHAWTGRMAFTRHKMPIVREMAPDLWALNGFGGHGLNATAIAGEVLARHLALGDDAVRLFDPFGAVTTGGAFGPLAARGLVWGRSLQDAWRMRG